MCAKLSDILDFERKGAFVGRESEIQLFSSVLNQQGHFLLLFYYGPGGQGKTTLLKKCADLCIEQGILHIHLDGREINAHPSSFMEALHTKLQLRPFEDVFSYLDKLTARHVLFIDTYEKLFPIDDWFRQSFLPQLPTHFTTVIMGRNPPSIAWTIDPGWKKYMKSMQVRNLSPDEANVFLHKRNLPEAVIPQILEFTHGHPLALSVVADLFTIEPNQYFNPDKSPDLIKSLLELFIQHVPGPAHRAVMEISALAHVTTESLLQEVMGIEQIQGLFDWLRGLSFYDHNQSGIFPHDIAREALSRDLKWRNPEWFAALHEKIRNFYIRKLTASSGVNQRNTLFELIYLHRLNPMVKPFFDWAETGSFWQDQYRPSDFDILKAMVFKHEGDASALTFEYWVKHAASETWVYRNSEGLPLAFVLKIDIHKIPEQERVFDMAVQKVIDFNKRNWNPRQEEMVCLFRYWMAEDTYQGVSNLQSVMFLSIVQYYFTPGLAVSALACARPEFWKIVLNYADLNHITDLDFNIHQTPFGWYMHDWRKRPPLVWLDIMGKREIEMVDSYDQASAEAVSILVLSREEFDTSVQNAIRYYHQSDLLLNNPLLKSRLVLREVPEGSKEVEKVKVIKTFIDLALKEIESSPVDGKYYRILHRTFINPVGSQEKVADYLNMSFSTYRRYLKSALEKLVKLMWNMELDNN